MDRLRFINELYPESKNRIDDKCNLTWNNIIFLLGVFDEEKQRVSIKQKNCTDCDFNIGEKCKVTGLIISKEFAKIRCGQHSHYL